MKNQYSVDWQLLKQWANESRFRGIRLAMLVMWCILLLVTIWLCIQSFIISAYSYVVFYFLLGLFCFYRAFVMHIMSVKYQYKRYVKVYGKTSWVRTVDFEDDKIVITEENTQGTYSYSDIVAITEKSDKVNLMLNGKLLIRVYKSKFVDCTWDECKVKILQNNPQIKDN